MLHLHFSFPFTTEVYPHDLLEMHVKFSLEIQSKTEKAKICTFLLVRVLYHLAMELGRSGMNVNLAKVELIEAHYELD